MISLDVLIPYYGDADLLLRAVESVQALVDTDWRLVIVEDAYPDGPAVERRVAHLADDRIHYVRNSRNLGTAGNHHRCVQLVEREHFVVMGADDLLTPSYGQTLADLVTRYPDAAMIQPGVRVIDEHDQPYSTSADRVKTWMRPRGGVLELCGELATASLLRGNWLYTPAIAYRRDHAIDLPMRPGTDAVHDLALVVDILLGGGSLIVSRDVGYEYRRHRNSHSSGGARTGQRFLQEKQYFADIESELRTHAWPAAARAARRRLLSRLHALAQLPTAVFTGHPRIATTLLAHALLR